MERGNIKLINPDRYSAKREISDLKINNTIKLATDKLLAQLDRYGDKFPGSCAIDLKYPLIENNNWVCGMHMGTILLAYELTGNEKFLDAAARLMSSFKKRIDEKINMDDHDVGFVFSPSCVAFHKVTGDEEAKKLALEAAEYLYSKSYSQKGGFILRSSQNLPQEWACRTMMDTLMNIPLLFWAYRQTGEIKYFDAASSQLNITNQYLIREDGSSFHHYQFDVENHKPVRGLTFQGHTDDSCWSRGHAWGVLGFPIAYGYTGNKTLFPLHRDVTYFMLNHLPEDNIPFYDYDFVSKCEEARDASAGLISACGMMEACKYLPDDAPEKAIYKNASSMLLEAVIDNCADYDKTDFDGLIRYVTCSAPHNIGVDGCALYGDYFYLAALMRYINPEWKGYW